MKLLYPLILTNILFSSSVGGAEDIEDMDPNNLLNMDLKELIQLKFESASKRTEPLFDSPLSSTVITQEQLKNSGARSIMEGLRLVPGIIVREQTAGNYDIHIRGLDNVPPNSLLYSSISTTTLVMIDYRVVYNYFQGGTFWDALPIDINDVEKIEVIRGPAAALYGPNAVSGVINIITRTPHKNGFFVKGTAQGDFFSDQRIANGSFGYQYNPFSITLSANYQHMDRYQATYYSQINGQWYDDPKNLPMSMSSGLLDHPRERFPRRDLATDRFAGNIFLKYHPREEIDLDLSAGYQNSLVQKIYIDILVTPLTTNSSKTFYSDLRTKIFGATAQASYLFGTQSIPLGTFLGTSQDEEVYTYDFKTIDTALDYEWRKGAFTIRPAVSFRRAEYEGPLIYERDLKDYEKIYNRSKHLQSLGGAIRTEYTLFEKLRLIAALRFDYYFDREEPNFYLRPLNESPRESSIYARQGKDLYFSYQFAGTYKFNEKNLARVVYSRAHRAPFIMYSYLNDRYFQNAVNKIGDRSLDLLTTDMVEIGYRKKFWKYFDIDLDAFYSYTRNFVDMYLHYADPNNFQFVYSFDQIDTKAAQVGSTLSLGLHLSRINLGVFSTIQRTMIYDHAANTLHYFDFQYNPRDPQNQEDFVH